MRSEDLKKCEEVLGELYEMIESLSNYKTKWEFGDICDGKVTLYRITDEVEDAFDIPFYKFSDMSTLSEAINDIEYDEEEENDNISCENDNQKRESLTNKERKTSKQNFR